MSKLRIGIFTDSYKPYTSGVVRSIDTFRHELYKLEQEIFIFAPNYPDCEQERGVFRYASVPAPTNPDYTIAIPFSLKLNKLINNLNLDIIHTHSPFILGRVGLQQAKKLNIPLVFTFHTLYEEYVHYVPFARSITKNVTQRICSYFCNQCNLIITPTKIIGEHIKNQGVKSPVINIPTGIQIDEYASGNKTWLQKNYNIEYDKKILLCVGRLGKEKNIEWLIEAISLVEKNFPNIHLVLVGGGPEKEHLLKKAAELGIKEKISFTGVLPKEKVINCYNSADLFVFTSLTETQGLVIGEAKAAGLPVIAVNAYGVSEMVENNQDGFLTNLSQEEFSNATLLLLQNNNLRMQMSSKAKLNAEKISSRNCAKKLLYYYTDLVQNNRKKAAN
ncbi:MAG: glycosyltransferase [Clostridiales bacterium]|nr:glycosyltransferase [Clostridiales bacterium]MCF8021998.1 glycosyltransferase [Clostridiales bacterium]